MFKKIKGDHSIISSVLLAGIAVTVCIALLSSIAAIYISMNDNMDNRVGIVFHTNSTEVPDTYH